MGIVFKGIRAVVGLIALAYGLWVVGVGTGGGWMAYQTQEEIEAAEAEAAERRAEYANVQAGYGTRDPSFRPEYATDEDFDRSYGKPDRTADHTDGGWGPQAE